MTKQQLHKELINEKKLIKDKVGNQKRNKLKLNDLGKTFFWLQCTIRDT